MKRKTYPTVQPKSNKITFHIGKVKTRVQMQTVRSAQYSFYDRATRRVERQLKQELKSYY